jgi:phage terminase large subunit-like protein
LANPNESKTVSITLDDLKTLFTEIRKPVKSEKEIREEEQQKLDQAASREGLIQAEKNRLHKIASCSHMRPNGSTMSVYILDLNKLYCQACGGWISPTENPEVFNRLYQLAV